MASGARQRMFFRSKSSSSQSAPSPQASARFSTKSTGQSLILMLDPQGHDHHRCRYQLRLLRIATIDGPQAERIHKQDRGITRQRGKRHLETLQTPLQSEGCRYLLDAVFHPHGQHLATNDVHARSLCHPPGTLLHIIAGLAVILLGRINPAAQIGISVKGRLFEGSIGPLQTKQAGISRLNFVDDGLGRKISLPRVARSKRDNSRNDNKGHADGNDCPMTNQAH